MLPVTGDNIRFILTLFLDFCHLLPTHLCISTTFNINRDLINIWGGWGDKNKTSHLFFCQNVLIWINSFCILGNKTIVIHAP